jgi:hypothetical protein
VAVIRRIAQKKANLRERGLGSLLEPFLVVGSVHRKKNAL